MVFVKITSLLTVNEMKYEVSLQANINEINIF